MALTFPMLMSILILGCILVAGYFYIFTRSEEPIFSEVEDDGASRSEDDRQPLGLMVSDTKSDLSTYKVGMYGNYHR